MCGPSQANNIDKSLFTAGRALRCACFVPACSAAAPLRTDLAGTLPQGGTVDLGTS